jgi:alkanesulfonate monooxygenase SsuD/methylene tetrahydromethanopterin reductase-like flavin-dependent oxidoreductase (luciferase family)
VLRATSALRVGTLVTNPVTRHWSVQAAAFRTHEEIGPGRLFMGIGTGDTAVLEVGLRPARIAELEAYVARFRELAPASVRVLVAAGGPKAARGAAAYADGLVLGQGVARESVERLSATADDVRAATDRPPLAKWLFLITSLVARASDEEVARSDVREAVSGQAQGDPRRLEEIFDNFAVVGTPEAAAERVRRVVDETGIRRVFMAIISADTERVVRLATSRMLPRLLG